MHRLPYLIDATYGHKTSSEFELEMTSLHCTVRGKEFERGATIQALVVLVDETAEIGDNVVLNSKEWGGEKLLREYSSELTRVS